MFHRMEAHLVMIGMTKKELATKTGIQYNTLLLKLSGGSPITLDEAVAIRDAIGWKEPIDDLYAEAYIREDDAPPII